ncbi:MAG: hypothetical protein KKA73_20325 [Chloroflexi bacterium]|nr:hypothetical protein [Chloroflexota bacterium]MBU1750037.1 hypothetical protein [Chloroflexota bacterium]
MVKTLRVPHETRFVQALALAVEPADALSLLLEIGALRDRDLGPVRRIRAALESAYEQAAAAQDWDLAHAASVLRHALGEPDHQAYRSTSSRRGLAHQVRQHELTPAPLVEALAAIGCGSEDRQRPWHVSDWSSFGLDRWRERVRRLFQSSCRLSLPAPGASPPPESPVYTIEATARLMD